MKLILVRHGETEENARGIIQGQKIHGKLSKRGKEQAERVALRLKDEKIDIIYSSDLKRALDTAKEISKYHDVPLLTSREIRERHFGDIEGKRADALNIKERIGELKNTGESLEELYKRAERFIHYLLKKHNNENVLIVSHGSIGRAIISVILGKNAEDIYEIDKLKNTSISIFELREDKKHRIHTINCTKHLEESK